MMRFSHLSFRNLLIAVHDALATALAIFASFYLRFEGDAFFDRLPILLRILPLFAAFSVVVCYTFSLTTTKWRFISLPDALNILRTATVLTLGLVVLDYIFVAPNVHGTFFLGKVTIVLYWFLEVFFLSALRFPHRYFRYTRVRPHARTEGASPTLLIGRAADAEILLRGIENSEPALYAVTEALAAHATGTVIEGRIADIRDRERIQQLMNEFEPDIVFHAAALKHVPILERDWSEGVKTNIFGSINVADAALAAGAEAMVMISTDKAIEPVSMLGLTKRFAEMYCQALDHDLASQQGGRPRMRLISVRFGNVLASNGSVVPKFKAQIETGGPVTVTHPDMVRYFMTIREACDLVITAATHALAPVRPDVSVYVLNMGQPVKIVDLAERMIRLSGLQPGHDIDIVFTGIRPGERLNEILFATEEPAVEIGVAGIMAAKPNEPPMQSLREWIAALKRAVEQDDRASIKEVLKDAVPEFAAGIAPASQSAPARIEQAG